MFSEIIEMTTIPLVNAEYILNHDFEKVKTFQINLKTILAAFPGVSDVYNNSFILREITFWTPLVCSSIPPTHLVMTQVEVPQLREGRHLHALLLWCPSCLRGLQVYLQLRDPGSQVGGGELTSQ